MSVRKKILLLDKKADTRLRTTQLLAECGYEIIETSNREQALEMLRCKAVDLAVLDPQTVDLPEVNLGQEADYYVVKPCRLDELSTLLESWPRRANPLRRGGTMELDPIKRRLTFNGRTVDFSATEYRLMECLMAHQGEILSRERLLREVWGKDFDTGTNVISVYIRYLRNKIGDPYPGKLIRTIGGQGYCLGDPADTSEP